MKKIILCGLLTATLATVVAAGEFYRLDRNRSGQNRRFRKARHAASDLGHVAAHTG